jgi:hypothetical protein
MESFTDLAKGLLTLEINTVQKDGMSAQKMPTPANALIEVIQNYWDFLCQKTAAFGPSGQPLTGWADILSKSFGWGREPFPQAGPEDRPLDHPEGEPRPAGHIATFFAEPPAIATRDILDHLREIATWLAEMQLRIQSLAAGESRRYPGLRETLSDDDLREIRVFARRIPREDRPILHRIRRNCDQFKPIVGARRIDRSSPDGDFQPPDLIAIRKAWDLGTEAILLQTVIQLDGDIVTRFQNGMDQPSREVVHTLHARAVDLSFRHWQWLFEAVGRVAGQTVSRLLGGA